LSFIEVAPGSVSGASYNRGAKSLVSGAGATFKSRRILYLARPPNSGNAGSCIWRGWQIQGTPDLVFSEAGRSRERRILYLARLANPGNAGSCIWRGRQIQGTPDLEFGEDAKFRERRILYLAPATSRFAAISSNRQEIYSPQRVGFIERNLRKNIHLARFTLTELQFKDLPIPKRSIQ